MESCSRNENENEVYPYAYPGCIFLQWSTNAWSPFIVPSSAKGGYLCLDVQILQRVLLPPRVISFAHECIFVNVAFLFSWKKHWKKYSWIDAQLFLKGWKEFYNGNFFFFIWDALDSWRENQRMKSGLSTWYY